MASPLVPLHGLSPTLKSLKLDESTVSPPGLIDIVCSFPLLEGFWLRCSVIANRDDTDGRNTPSTSPKLTGSLDLHGGIRPIVHRMLDLPGGLHFAKTSTCCYVGDVNPTMDLVSMLSGTLRSLFVGYYLSGFPSTCVVINTLPLHLDRGRTGLCLRLTSPGQQNSKTWSFGVLCRESGGSLRRSWLLNPCASGRSPSTCVPPSRK